MSSVNTRTRRERLRATVRKIAFEELYSHFAWAYDWVSGTFFLGQWKLWQRTTVRYLVGNRVLEVGMGTGDLQIYLLCLGYHAWGTDFSPQMLRQAFRKARRSGLCFNMCRAKAQELPFPDGIFDSVVSTFPSDYIIDPLTLAEISRVLRPGGRFVVAPGGWLHPGGARSSVLDLVSRLVYGDRTGGTGIEETQAAVAEELRKHVTGSTWIGLLASRMENAGLHTESKLLSNRQGSVLIVTGDKGSGGLQTSTRRSSPEGD